MFVLKGSHCLLQILLRFTNYGVFFHDLGPDTPRFQREKDGILWRKVVTPRESRTSGSGRLPSSDQRSNGRVPQVRLSVVHLGQEDPLEGTRLSESVRVGSFHCLVIPLCCPKGGSDLRTWASFLICTTIDV